MAYATRAQLAQLGISASALSDVPTATQDAVLEACSARVDDALLSGGVYSPPLVAWPSSVTQCVCKLAQYELIGCEGYSPDTGTEPVLLERYRQAEACLKSLASGSELVGAVDSTPDEDGVSGGEPAFDSDTARGW